MADLPDFLSDEPSSAPEPTAAAPEGQAPEAAAPAAPAGDQPQPSAAAAPAASPADPQGHSVPLATFLDLRDRATAAEKDAKELREWRQQQEEAARRRPPPAAPDPDQDPEGYRQYQAAAHDQSLYSMRLEMSRGFAETRHGAETVSQAFDWGVKRCDEDPFFNAKVRASKDPVGLVVDEWKREQQLSTMTPDDIAAFQAWKAAQTAAGQPGAQPAAASAAAPPAKPAAPRPSIASGPSAGASGAPEARDGQATFDAMFGR
jgi:hypothetical protein